MATEVEESGGLNWTFGSYVFQHAFAKLATSLWWMFWGLLVQLLGTALAIVPLVALLGGAQVNPKLVLPGIIAMTLGGIVLLVGEMKCLHLELPLGMTRSLPGHHWLRAALWCHLGSWLLRIARSFLNRGLVGLVLLPLQLLGFVFLLMFLRKTADMFGRRDLKWLVDAIFIVAGATVMAGAFLAAEAFLELGMLKLLPRVVAMAIFVLPLILFLGAIGAYLVLLGRMASAASGFAKYLSEIEQLEQVKEMWSLADEMGWHFDRK